MRMETRHETAGTGETRPETAQKPFDQRGDKSAIFGRTKQGWAGCMGAWGGGRGGD